MRKSIVLLLFICSVASSNAQKKELTGEQYFKNNFKGIISPLPSITKWLDNTHFVMNKDSKTWVVDATNGNQREATDQEKGSSSTLSKPTAFMKGADLFIKIENKEIQLTNDSAKELNPTMSPDGNSVAYTKNNDLYVIEISTQKETRLTFDGSDVILNGYASWVYMEEILGRASQYRSFWWSPDSKHIAFFRSDDSKVPTYTITDAPGQHGYVDVIRYPKVGDPNPEVKVGVVSSNGGNIVWVDFNEHDDQYFGLPYWKPDGKSLLVQWMNRKQNQLKIWEINPMTGAKSIFLSEEQKTWISLDDEGKRITFLKNGKGFIYRSDANGYDQLYYYDMKGKLVNPLIRQDQSTPDYNTLIVTDLNYIDEKNNVVYFTARRSKIKTDVKDFYRVNLNGKNLKCLTAFTLGESSHTNILLSPDASYFITTFSSVTVPPSMVLIDNRGQRVKLLANAEGDSGFKNTILAKTEMIRVRSDDGLFSLPMKITWPLNMEKGKKYPVLISIYGGPNAGTVWNTWSLSGSQQWYAKEGLIQVAMDHRASGHFGKAGVNYMYHNLGYWEMKDYSTMVKWLIENGQADSSKIAITGFSYGGYLSCYALTYGANVFTHGMAGGSVIDWTLYDSHYTERFMGTPNDNPDGYKTSNVLNYVDKYKGMLQVVHGIVDENVHLQNSIQFASKLQDFKKNFEFMTYSGGRHGWGGNKQLHFQNLKTRFIYKYLLEKETPTELLK